MEQLKDKALIFGLDIGTRTVIGSVGYMEKDKWHLIASTCKCHEERAMIDGQIHDIEKVARIVEEVKKDLESQINRPLKQVALAAAGRVLSTQVVHVEKQQDEKREITREDVQSIEVEGILQAKQLLSEDTKKMATEYFCVAYTVMNYYLDEYVMTHLEGHKGDKIGVSLLATFLPKVVIDSLYAVTKRVGLEVSYLTLEPIAAMNAIIPPNIRLLNLALVDIGAGTSDIAITREGTVTAYGMIPFAGDEVTEAIVHHYLVDFNTAEQIKMQLSQENITYTDIIGFENTVSNKDVLCCIEPVISQLAKEISKKIMKLNGRKATNAVFCVGGGSQMPGLIEKIGELLELPKQRVAMRLTSHIQQMEVLCDIEDVPEMITPIGICLTAAKEIGKEFMRITLNDEPLALLHTKKLVVLDALMEKGVEHTQIFPVNGKTLMFKLNGKRIRVKGTLGQACQLFLNGQEAAIDTALKEGDRITFIPATKGKDGVGILGDYVDIKNITPDGEGFVSISVQVNGKQASPKYRIKEQDSIEVITTDHRPQANRNEIKIVVNEKELNLPHQEEPYIFAQIFDYIHFDLTKPQGTVKMLLNNEPASVTDELKQGDNLTIYWEN